MKYSKVNLIIVILITVVFSCKDNYKYINKKISIKDFQEYHEYWKLPIKFSSWTVHGNDILFLTKNSIFTYRNQINELKEQKYKYNMEYSDITSVKFNFVNNYAHIVESSEVESINLTNNKGVNHDFKKLFDSTKILMQISPRSQIYNSSIIYNNAVYCEIKVRDLDLNTTENHYIKIRENSIEIDHKIRKLFASILENTKDYSKEKWDTTILSLTDKKALLLVKGKENYTVLIYSLKKSKLLDKFSIGRKEEKFDYIMFKHFEYSQGKLYYLYHYTKDEVKFKIYDIKM